MADGRRRRLATLGIASAGVLVAHWLTYLLHTPDAGRRAAVLTGTGHGYLSVAGELVGAFLAVSVAAVFLGRLVDAGSGPAPGRALAVTLTMVQTGAFAAMEILERLLAGAGLHDLAADILPLGIVVNVVVGLVGALLLRSILRLADRVAGSVAGAVRAVVRARAGAIRLAPPSAAPRLPHPSLATLPVRGPPSPVHR